MPLVLINYIRFRNICIHRRIQWAGARDLLLELSYQLVKTRFNRIYPISSLLLFFLQCCLIFTLNYALLWNPIKKKTSPPLFYGNVWIRLWYICHGFLITYLVSSNFTVSVPWCLHNYVCFSFELILNLIKTQHDNLLQIFF